MTKNLKRKVTILCIVIGLIMLLPNYVIAGEVVFLDRIKGNNRFETAATISQIGWSDADTVIIARSDNYADALAGVSLAYKLNAPILLTGTNSLHKDTLSEIKRLNPDNIIILGGVNAISDSIQLFLGEQGFPVERIGGTNRYETAAKIARRVSGGKADTAVIVFGKNFHDAMVASPFAARLGYPILLTNTNKLAKETETAIRDLGVNNTIVVGNQDVISDSVLNVLPNGKRIENPAHHTNAVAVAKYFRLNNSNIYVATSKGFVDAMAGAVLVAKNNSGIFLVDDNVPYEVAQFIHDNVNSVTIFGGTSAVSAIVEEKLKSSDWTSISGLGLHAQTKVLGLSESCKLSALITPLNASNQGLIWRSTNEGVASVNHLGNVSAHNTGIATISAATTDGSNLIAECKVIVQTEVPDRFISSYFSRNCIELIIVGNKIIVSGNTLEPILYNRVWLHINHADGEYFRNQFIVADSNKTFHAEIPVDLDDGNYLIGISSGGYWLNKLPLSVRNGVMTFGKELISVYSHNLETYKANTEVKLEYLKLDFYADELEILRDLADEIIQDSPGDYDKVLAINNWVADNIYYDLDAYYSGSYGDLRTDALGTLENKKSVCQGYAELTLALLRSAGIPSRLVTGHALGLSAGGRPWEEVDHTKANHAWNEAYVDGRWIIIDTTWNSNNKFRNGKFKNQPRDYNYFDISIENFSLDHKIIQYSK